MGERELDLFRLQGGKGRGKGKGLVRLQRVVGQGWSADPCWPPAGPQGGGGGGKARGAGSKRRPQARRTGEAHGRGAATCAATWDRAVRAWNWVMAGRLHSDALSSAVRRIWMLAALARLRPAMFWSG